MSEENSINKNKKLKEGREDGVHRRGLMPKQGICVLSLLKRLAGCKKPCAVSDYFAMSLMQEGQMFLPL